MKKTLPAHIEVGRIRSGPWASPDSATFGAFIFKNRRGVRFQAIVADGEETGWDHVSVCLPNRKRTPTWEEMCWIKDQFFEPSEAVYQIHPRADDYVNDHPYVLHLWRPTSEAMPLPDPIMVGLGRKTNANQKTTLPINRSRATRSHSATNGADPRAKHDRRTEEA